MGGGSGSALGAWDYLPLRLDIYMYMNCSHNDLASHLKLVPGFRACYKYSHDFLLPCSSSVYMLIVNTITVGNYETVCTFLNFEGH